MCFLVTKQTELETRMCFLQRILKHVETRVCLALSFQKKLRNAHVFAPNNIDKLNVFFCVFYEIPGEQVSNITVCVFATI